VSAAIWTARDTPTWSVGVSPPVPPPATPAAVTERVLAPAPPSEQQFAPEEQAIASTGRRVARRRAERARLRIRRLAGSCRLAVATGAWSIGWLVVWVLVPTVALGWTPVAITSGSMAPLIRAGDVVVLQPGGELTPGAVVTVPRGDGRVTHRLVSQRDDGTWVTRGDANAAADRERVHADGVLGVGRLVVPFIGWPAATVTSVGTSSATFTASTGAAASLRTSTLTSPAVATACSTSTSTILLGSRGRTAVILSWGPVTDAADYLVQRRRPWAGEAGFSTIATTASISFRDPASGFTPSAHGDMDTNLLGSTSRTNEYRVIARRGNWSATSPTSSVTAQWVNLLGIGTFTCG
jgi:signal peptidase I